MNQIKSNNYVRNTIRTSRKALLGLGLLISALPVQADMRSDVTLMTQVPSTYELASALFPRPTRGLYLSQEQHEPEDQKIAFIINFEYNSARVMTPSLPYLDAVGKMLNQENLKDKKLIIEGHADAKGDHLYNLGLSELRAQAVKRYLVSVHGIDPKRLLSMGKGDTELLDPEHPYSMHNRRVQFLAWTPGK